MGTTPLLVPPRDVGPGVNFPPPFYLAIGFAVGVALSARWPLGASVFAHTWLKGLGLVVVLLGFGLTFTGIRTFRRARVSVLPNRPARSVVTHGIYRFTRNPMYTGFTIAYLGGVLMTGSVWALLLLPLVLWVLTVRVIRREEAHLRERFPEEYGAYCQRVGRWF